MLSIAVVEERVKQVNLDGPWFKDEQGRTLILRGVNLSGSSKIPAVFDQADFYNHRAVSFVGRPFPLAEADGHFDRLRHWGLTCLRFIVPWEAIEHAGPGHYDEAYLAYLVELLHKAHQYGLQVFIDPHQDVWSRMTGGDGAPGWTLELAGFDLRRLHLSDAAIMFDRAGKSPPLNWLANYTRLATATMFTLFFGGNDFAPQLKIAGEPIQCFLQRHYIKAFQQVALAVRDLPNVIGFGTMNEPSAGFIGLADLTHDLPFFPVGPAPTPFQAMLLGAGYPQDVTTWTVGPRGLRRNGKTRLNPEGVCAWQEDRDCLWHEHGVWAIDDTGQPFLKRPDYFSYIERQGRPVKVNFGRDYLKPFVNEFARAIHQVDRKALIFMESVPLDKMPEWTPADAPNVVNASHWYDSLTLFTALFIPFLNVDVHARRFVFGQKRVQQMFVDQLAAIKAASQEQLGGIPTLVGEFGVSFNMPFKLNYWLNWFSMQEQALDASYQALDSHLLSATLWNYAPDNTNALGDRWNGEDLSIFSQDQQRDPDNIHSGGRAIRAAVRPYPRCTAGEPLLMNFDYRRRRFIFQYRHDPAVQAPTEIFVPALHYPNGCRVEVSDGHYQLDLAHHLLRYWHSPEQEVHTLTVRPQ